MSIRLHQYLKKDFCPCTFYYAVQFTLTQLLKFAADLPLGVYPRNRFQSTEIFTQLFVTHEVVSCQDFCPDYAPCQCTMQIRLWDFQWSITTLTGLPLKSILNRHSRHKGVTGKTIPLQPNWMQHKPSHIFYAFIQPPCSQFGLFPQTGYHKLFAVPDNKRIQLPEFAIAAKHDYDSSPLC